MWDGKTRGCSSSMASLNGWPVGDYYLGPYDVFISYQIKA